MLCFVEPSLARPVALKRGFLLRRLLVASVPASLALALGLAGLGLACEDAHRLLTQEDVVARGVRAPWARVDIVRDLSFSVFRARRYELEFKDLGGRIHRAVVRERDVALAPLIVEGPAVVHYLPSSPRRVAVSFARQNVGAQWCAVGVLGALGALAVMCAAMLGARLGRPIRAARAALKGGAWSVARVVRVRDSRDSSGVLTGERELTCVLEPRTGSAGYRESGRLRAPSSASFRFVTSASDPPRYVDANGDRLWVLVAPSGVPVAVRRSGHPFRFAGAATSSTPPPGARPSV